VILATGSVPRAIPGVELGGRIIGTEEAWALQELPARLAVVGAGASGAEIASGYARLGSEVILVEAVDRLLPGEDADISRLVERGLKRQGIAVHTSTPISDVQAGDSSVSFSLGEERAEVDYLVICAGRGADVQGLGLTEAAVELERGLVRVDGAMRTSRAGVYAIGDIVHGPALAHKASDEGIIAAEDSAGLPTHPIAYIDVPRATFCTPNVGSFGLTEAEAVEQGYDVVVGKVPYGAVGGGTVYGDRTGLVKVVGESRYGELLGGHIVGARATELIQELVNIRALEGGFPELGRIIHGHPTLSEAVMEAGRAADGWLIHG
jgi:dihydrolipoamide dehydrogenase